jgi:hypothetical protein
MRLAFTQQFLTIFFSRLICAIIFSRFVLTAY